MRDVRSTMREANDAAREKRTTEILVYLLTHGDATTAKLVSNVATICGGERLFRVTHKFVQSKLWIEGLPTAHPHNKLWRLTEKGRDEATARKAQREADKAKRTA